MGNKRYFKQNLFNFLQKFTKDFCSTLKILLFIAPIFFVASSIFFLCESLKDHSIKAYFTYLQAKFCTRVGLTNFHINIGNDNEVRAIDIVTNMGFIGNYFDVKRGILGSVEGGFNCAIYLASAIVLFVVFKRLIEFIIRKKLVSKAVIAIDEIFFDVPPPVKINVVQTIENQTKPQITTTQNQPIQTKPVQNRNNISDAPLLNYQNNQPAKTTEKSIAKKPKLSSSTKQPIAEESNPIVKTEFGNYQVIPDSTLPYPMLKRVIFTEPEKDLEPLKSNKKTTLTPQSKPEKKVKTNQNKTEDNPDFF